MSKSALGKGLGSLIPHKQTVTEQVIPQAHQEVREVAVTDIVENPHQPRQHFAQAELEDLMNSIQEHGMISPLIVTPKGQGYELIAGERRLRSARQLGWKTVPVIVRDATDQQKLELALIENIQRQDLSVIEEALAYKALVEEFNLTQDQVASRVGKSRSTVTNILRLLELPEDILHALQKGKISKSHARTLLAEPDAIKQHKLFERMLEGGVTVREAEAKVVSVHAKKKQERVKDPNLLAHEKKLREVFGTKIIIIETAGKGKITIEFYSKEELLDLLERLERI